MNTLKGTKITIYFIANHLHIAAGQTMDMIVLLKVVALVKILTGLLHLEILKSVGLLSGVVEVCAVPAPLYAFSLLLPHLATRTKFFFLGRATASNIGTISSASI